MNPTFDLIRACVALLFVVGLMWSLGYVLRRYGTRLGLPMPPLTGANRRLQLVEILPLDGRNKVVLVRRDNTEHLLVIGPGDPEVIEKNIPAGTINPSETK